MKIVLGILVFIAIIACVFFILPSFGVGDKGMFYFVAGVLIFVFYGVMFFLDITFVFGKKSHSHLQKKDVNNIPVTDWKEVGASEIEGSHSITLDSLKKSYPETVSSKEVYGEKEEESMHTQSIGDLVKEVKKKIEEENLKSVTQKIAEHFKNGETLTTDECLSFFGYHRLPAIIYKLKKKGMEIAHQRVEIWTNDKKTLVNRYFLKK